MTDRVPAIKVLLLPKDTNALGTIFGGVILSHVDLASAVEARKVARHRYVTFAARGGSGDGIRPALHPTSHPTTQTTRRGGPGSRRCSSLEYCPVFTATPRRTPRVVGAPAVVAPLRGPQRADYARWGEGLGASPVSVRRQRFTTGC